MGTSFQGEPLYWMFPRVEIRNPIAPAGQKASQSALNLAPFNPIQPWAKLTYRQWAGRLRTAATISAVMINAYSPT
jgi:hypothetical protein